MYELHIMKMKNYPEEKLMTREDFVNLQPTYFRSNKIIKNW